MSQITETQLRRAAERAVAGGHAIAAILFGSRARGTAGPLSDWDVCLVTDGAERNEQGRTAALEADDDFWDDGRVETVWIARTRFDDGVSVGTLEAEITRDGKVLAGNGTMATTARTEPFEAETLHRNLGRASEHLCSGIDAARRHALETDEGLKRIPAVKILTDSIAGAEALGRALCALTETKHTGDHRVGKNGRRIGERAGEPNAPLETAPMNDIRQRVQALNDTAQAVREVEYGDCGEDHEKTIDRFVRAVDADLWTRQGLIEGTGPWAGLKKHPRRGELVEELERQSAGRAIMNAREWALRPVTLDDERLDQAVHRWVAGHQALRRTYQERKHSAEKSHERYAHGATASSGALRGSW